MRSKVAGLFSPVTARPRLAGTAVLGGLLWWLLPASFDGSTRILVAWNVATVAFLCLTGWMMATSDDGSMRRRAEATDEGRFAVLLLSMAAAITSLAAIVFELNKIRSLPTDQSPLYLILAVLTIVTAWTFVHVIFTEHYAHVFYVREHRGGKEPQLQFPGQAAPDYLDFLYFAFTVAVANQTADVAIASRGMRVLVLIHSVISYFFNAIILALTINIAAGLLAR